jgi:hypothetical protein
MKHAVLLALAIACASIAVAQPAEVTSTPLFKDPYGLERAITKQDIRTRNPYTREAIETTLRKEHKLRIDALVQQSKLKIKAQAEVERAEGARLQCLGAAQQIEVLMQQMGIYLDDAGTTTTATSDYESTAPVSKIQTGEVPL